MDSVLSLTVAGFVLHLAQGRGESEVGVGSGSAMAAEDECFEGFEVLDLWRFQEREGVMVSVC